MNNVEEIIIYRGKYYTHNEYKVLKRKPGLPGMENIFRAQDLLKKHTCAGHRSTIMIDVDADQVRLLTCCSVCKDKIEEVRGAFPVPHLS